MVINPYLLGGTWAEKQGRWSRGEGGGVGGGGGGRGCPAPPPPPPPPCSWSGEPSTPPPRGALGHTTAHQQVKKPTGCRSPPHPHLPLREGRQVEIIWTRKLPHWDRRAIQPNHIELRACSALTADVNSPYKRKCWTNSGGPLVHSVFWGRNPSAKPEIYLFLYPPCTHLSHYQCSNFLVRDSYFNTQS